jgi:hypothetical protein
VFKKCALFRLLILANGDGKNHPAISLVARVGMSSPIASLVSQTGAVNRHFVVRVLHEPLITDGLGAASKFIP